MEQYEVVISLGTLNHKDSVKASSTHHAVKKTATTIKNLIQKLECITPSAKVFQEIQGGAILVAEFPDIRHLLK